MKKYSFIFLILAFILISCNQNRITGSLNSKNSDMIDSLRIYFDKELAYYHRTPKNNYKSAFEIFNKYYFPSISKLDSADNRQFSYYLYGLEETSLFDKKVENPIYRFLWLRSFHHPILMKIEKEKRQTKYTARITDGAGGYISGKVITRIEKIFADSVWTNFTKMIDSSKFFELPSFEDPNKRGFDGSEWILEYKDKNKYHLVSQWAPIHQKGKNNISMPGLFLIRLLDVKIVKDEIY